MSSIQHAHAMSNPWNTGINRTETLSINYDVYEIFASADGNGLWDLSQYAISFKNNYTLLIQIEQSGRVMLYHLELDRYWEGLHYMPLSLHQILITHSSLVETPTWNIVDLVTLTESPNILSASRIRNIESSKAQVDVIWFDSTGNRRIHTWVIKPSNVQWHLALFSEQGFVVVATNPAGSSGFGQAFKDPVQITERGFEYLEQNESIQYIDTARSVAVGAGHRGYMVNWIQGHELGRKFRALVTHDGIVSMTSPLANNRQHSVEEIGGPIWETPDEWMKLDPAQLTLNYKRVIADELAALNVLQLRGVNSALLVFLEEGDPILNPEDNLLWYCTVINWMKNSDQKS
ncbi:Alpha/Beta hydrolase protein [Aspergillus fumigatus]